MKYLEFQPDPSLAKHIQLIWILESETKNECYPKKRIMPDGIVEIVFHYRTPFISYSGDAVGVRQPKGLAVSQMRKFIEIESDGDIGFVSIRFYPWGAHHFFKTRISTFLDGTISLAEIWPQHFQQIFEQIDNAVDSEERILAVQHFLQNRLRENEQVDEPLDQAVKLIRNSGGRLSIENICQQTGLSKKQLERKFLATLGTAPKVFSRISRFLSICHNLQDNKDKTLTQLAYECGYFDQAHFIKEFKEFSGFTPRQLFARDNIAFADIS